MQPTKARKSESMSETNNSIKLPVNEVGKARARPYQDGETSLPRQIRYSLERDYLLPEHKAVLRRYDQECDKNSGASESSRLNQLYVLTHLAHAVQKPFKDMTKEDLENYIFNKDLSPKSLNTHKILIRKFFKWLYRTEDFPSVVNWIKFQNNKKRKLPDDLLTHAEVRALIDATDNPRDRALISVLYESDCRRGEIVGLKQKDVTFDQYGAVIMVHGKTGDRPVRLINSSPDLTLWMNNHPNKGGDKPLWVNLHNPNTKLEGEGLKILVKKTAKKTGLEKRVYPHLFRHTRSTHLAKDFTEAELKVIAGWTPGSRMTDIYVTLSMRDVEKKLLEKAGLIPKDEARKEEEVLRARNCPRCKEINPATAKFCYRCGMALDMQTAVKIEKENSGIALEMLDLLKQHPRLLETLKKFEESQQVK